MAVTVLEALTYNYFYVPSNCLTQGRIWGGRIQQCFDEGHSVALSEFDEFTFVNGASCGLDNGIDDEIG